MKLRVNPEECARAVRLLHPNDDELFEIRLIGKNPHYAASGIFRTAETAVNALCNYKAGYKKDAAAEAASIYISLNPPVRECYSLAQHDKFVEGALTVNDNDIDCLNWLFIDLDPERRTGISASEEELERAENKAREVYVYLDKMGFSEPVAAMSGNGYHLMYRLDRLENCEENVQMLEDTLKAIGERFSGGGVKIDAVNFNPSRICKLWGSLAQKGSDTRERPHRMSYIKHIPEKGVRATPAELLFKVIEDCADAADKDSNVSAGHKPKKETARRKAGFDLDKWLAEHDLSVMGRKEKNGDTIYPLKHCVFDPSHTDNDAAIIKKADGTVCYHCFHNSCRDKGWRDVRQLFEPDAYKGKHKDKPVQNTFSADTQNDEPKTILLTVDSFTKFCEEYGFFFKWDAIKNEMIYGGFDKGENPVTLPNTAPTILQGILKPLGYKGASIDNICNCIRVVGTRNTYNAVLDKINGVEWDKVDRVSQIFDMWHITEDDTLSRTLIVKWLKQCYCMLHNTIDDPFSSEFALVFMGGQGAAKTRFFEKLAMINKYYGEGKSVNPDNKDSIMQATTVWICELGEIGSTMKKDLDKVKAFMTLAADEYRVPYGRTTERHPRITSFCGTVNDEQFLLDQTGNRRWGTVRLPEKLKVSFDGQIKPFNAEQLWSQVKQLVEEDLRNGCTYANCFRLTQEEQEQLMERNSSYTKPMKGLIEIMDIIDDLENNVADGYELKHKLITSTEFLRQHIEVLHNINANQVGQVFKKLGYEQQVIKQNGRTIRGYMLPYHLWTGKYERKGGSSWGRG